MILKKYMVFLIVFGMSITHVVYGQSQNKNLFDESVWRVEHLHNQKKIIQSYQEEKNFTHFSFNPYTHKVTGSGLCNKFLAKFEQHNDQITIHDIVTTHETCLLSDVNEQDNRFFSYLKSVKLFVIHGKILRLMDTDNHSLIIARWIK